MKKTDVTVLLRRWRSGDAAALEDLAAAVQSELRRLAASQLRDERRNHTLQPTALVNESFIRLIRQEVDWKDRSHFFAKAAQLMRQVLVDHARKRLAVKRTPPASPLTVAGAFKAGKDADVELLALDQALRKLARLDSRQCEVVELKFFGGLTNREVGQVLSVSEKTVRRDWSLARAYLYDLLKNPREISGS